MSIPYVKGLAADVTCSIFKAAATRAGLPTHTCTQAEREVLTRGRHAFTAQAASHPEDSQRHAPLAMASPRWRIQPFSPPSSSSVAFSSKASAINEASNSPSETEESPVPDQLRSLMRLLPHSVVVCTSFDRSESSTASPSIVPRAMTLSSFTTLALRPTPMVNFNITMPSRTLSALEHSRCFNIHVLRGDTSGARIADWFTKGNAKGSKVFEELGSPAGPGCRAEFASASSGAETTAEAPLLRGQGVQYVLRCKLLDDAPMEGLVRVRDDVIVVGEVTEVLQGRGGDEAEREDEYGLVYADRRYRRIGESIVKETM